MSETQVGRFDEPGEKIGIGVDLLDLLAAVDGGFL